jgi:hypothetical protein
VRAIIDYALHHGWDPAVTGGHRQLRADDELDIPGFRVTDQLGLDPSLTGGGGRGPLVGIVQVAQQAQTVAVRRGRW